MKMFEFDAKVVDILKKQNLYTNENFLVIAHVFSILWKLLENKDSIEFLEWDDVIISDFLRTIKYSTITPHVLNEIQFYLCLQELNKSRFDQPKQELQRIYWDFIRLYFIKDKKYKNKNVKESIDYLKSKYKWTDDNLINSSLYHWFRIISRLCHPCDSCKYNERSWETRYWFCDHKTQS